MPGGRQGGEEERRYTQDENYKKNTHRGLLNLQ